MWKACCSAVILIAMIFYFLLLKEDVSNPYFLGFPYIMWVGMVVTVLLVGLTIFAKSIFPFKED